MKTISQEILLQNMSRLDKLKANIHLHPIQNYVAFLRDKWKPQTMQFKHNSETITYYWDEYNHNWTIEEMAFKGYVFKQVNEIMQKSSVMGNPHLKFKNEAKLDVKDMEVRNEY